MGLALINCVDQFRVTKARESTQTENAIHFEPHTFHIFRVLAPPTALASAWFDIEIYMTLRF